MRVGIDYWNTISHNVETFTDLARALLAAGHEVHIVTAVGHVRKKTVRADIEALDIPHTDVHVVIFDHPREAPTRKYAVCKAVGITLFFDDRMDTCEYLNERSIVACNVLRRRADTARVSAAGNM